VATLLPLLLIAVFVQSAVPSAIPASRWMLIGLSAPIVAGEVVALYALAQGHATRPMVTQTVLASASAFAFGFLVLAFWERSAERGRGCPRSPRRSASSLIAWKFDRRRGNGRPPGKGPPWSTGRRLPRTVPPGQVTPSARYAAAVSCACSCVISVWIASVAARRLLRPLVTGRGSEYKASLRGS
jgi:hypothetical protein